MVNEKQNKDKPSNTGPLVSQDVPTTFDYLKKPIKPKRPSPKKKSGIILEDKYAKLIRARKKKEIISKDNLSKYVGKEIFLCGKGIYGSIILNEPLVLNRSLLKSHSKRHLITDYDINRLWPEEKTFYAYSFRITKMFKKLDKYKNMGINFGFIDNIEFKNKTEISKMPDTKNLNKALFTIKELEGIKIEASNTRLDKYINKLRILKAQEFKGRYKDIFNLFLFLYELYLEKANRKIYDKDGVVLKPVPDVTENYIRIRIRDPRTIVEGSFRTITISASQGIKAVIGKLRKEPNGPTKVQSVLFEKDKWTVTRATTWVKEHKEDLKSFDSDKFKEAEKASPKKVQEKEKIKTEKIWICPHCNKEIGEKELYCNEKTDEWFHRPCIDNGPIELPDEKNSDCYAEVGYIDRDKDTGKQEEKWVWCSNCEKSFDYYKVLIDAEESVVCPHCGALFTYEEN